MDQSNVINIIGSTAKGISVSQKNQVENLCSMQTILNSNIGSDVEQKLLDAVKNSLSTSGGLLGSAAKNETISRNITKNSTKIDNEKFNEISKQCISDIKQENIFNLTSVFIALANELLGVLLIKSHFFL